MTSRALTPALRAMVPDAGAPEPAYPAAFAAMAQALLDVAELRVAGVAHRITEVEFYVREGAHADPFTHGDPTQAHFGRWYFHRVGDSYRGGSFKGLDLALGVRGGFGGALLRGVARVGPPEALIDGPCRVVDHLLATTGAGSIAALVARFDGRADPTEGSPLCLARRESPWGVTMHASPRVGLTLRRGDTPTRRRFLSRDYRFTSEPARVKKGRAQLVVGMHRRGMPPAQIAAVTSMRVAAVQSYVAAYEAGRASPTSVALHDASARGVCALLGACDAG